MEISLVKCVVRKWYRESLDKSNARTMGSVNVLIGNGFGKVLPGNGLVKGNAGIELGNSAAATSLLTDDM